MEEKGDGLIAIIICVGVSVALMLERQKKYVKISIFNLIINLITYQGLESIQNQELTLNL